MLIVENEENSDKQEWCMLQVENVCFSIYMNYL